MRRSLLIQVTVHCPHFQRSVSATLNAAIERLVSCGESEACRDPAPAASAPLHARPFPTGCPVYPSLAK